MERYLQLENSKDLKTTFSFFITPIYVLGPIISLFYFLLGAKNAGITLFLTLAAFALPIYFLKSKQMWTSLSVVLISFLTLCVSLISLSLHYEGRTQFHLFTIVLMVDFLSQALNSKKLLSLFAIPVVGWFFLDLKVPIEHFDFAADTYVQFKAIEFYESFCVILVFSTYTFLHNFYLDTSRRRRIEHVKNIQNELSIALSEADHFFEMSLGFMVISNGQGRIIKANKAFCEALGYSLQELKDMSILEIIKSDDHQKSTKAVEKLKINPELVGFENRFIAKCGKELTIMWSSAKDTKTGLVYSAGKDLTFLKKKITDYEQLLIAINQSAIVTVSDVNGGIVSVNQHFLDLSGYTESELFGRSHQLLYFDEFDRNKYFEIGDALKEGNSWSGEIVSRSKNGDLYYTDTVITPVKNQEGVVERFLGIRFDKTREKHLQQLAEQQKSKAIQSSKLASLGEMSAGVAHEINNPLAIISTCAEMIKRKNDAPAVVVKNIETIEKSVHRIARIVLSLKKFSRTHAQKQYAAESLKSILEESLFLTHAKSTIYQTPIELFIETNAFVYGDAVELEQVFINLIHNAIDVAKNGHHRWVRVYAFEEGAEVVIQIVDPGNGIEPQIADRILEPFFTTKQNGEGTGLGLSITKGILDEHGAELRIKTKDSHTCFEVRFIKSDLVSNAA